MNDTSKRILRANLLYLLPSFGIFAFPYVVSYVLYRLVDDQSAVYALLSENQFLLTFLLHMAFLLIPALLFLWRNPSLRARFRWRPSALLGPVLALLGFFAIMLVTLLWNLLLTQIGLSQPTSPIPTPTTGAELGLSMAVISLMPAITEELFFRGSILPSYERRDKKMAIVVSGAMFGLLHGQIFGMPAHVMLGILLGWIVVTSDTVWTGVLYHLTHNALVLLILYGANQVLASQGAGMDAAMAEAQALMAEPGAQLVQIAVYGVLALVAGAAFFAMLVVLYRMAKMRNRREGGDGKVYALPPDQPRERVSPLAYLPLIPSIALIVYTYGSDIAHLLGAVAG